jgi:tetratricopeptide (TPR) repeat protein
VGFGDALLAEHDPFNALTYYRLALHLDPDRPDAGAIRFRVALCYERGDRFDAAAQAWLDVAGRHPDLSDRATYRAALANLDADRPIEAIAYLNEVRAESPESPWAERAEFVVGVAALESHDLAAADAAFATFASTHPQSPLATRAGAARDVLATPPRRRSPALAGVMSTIVPGTGQMYAGHVGDGVMALLADGSLALFTSALLRDGIEDSRTWEIATGGVLGGFTLVFWSANTLGAVRGATRANEHEVRVRAEGALREADHPDLERDAEDVALPPRG